ncbi:stage II sporulation protein M [Patulibacter brassicae]|uniref:Stage II sporulation protein M n=1 Tax=Patulibacter brassicae TaxID=1705717 RepID=A0ABU4VN85_9ACTN|nr:stage II sporulation protein M [Patulibacter brassicae]MDX8152240.1 stage II sporulation protein M [Patulibacter brassicae]
MNLPRFLETREPAWRALEELVRQAGTSRPEHLGPAGILRLGTAYRSAVADLAFARRAFPDAPATLRLETLVERARTLVYAHRQRRTSPWAFAAGGYWRLVRALGGWLALSAAALLVPALVVGVWAALDPAVAATLVPDSFIDGAAPPDLDRGLSSSDSAAFSSELFTNNIRVTFLSFVAGVGFALPAVLLVAYNGAILGAVLGLAAANGNLGTVLRMVTAHGALELTCIVVAAAAGMAAGWRLVDPGDRPRGHALRDAARPAVLVVAGTAPFLVLCGVVEGFVSPAGWPAVAVVALGLGLAGGYWALVRRLGRA